MSVYKDEKTGKWYALAWYHDWKGEGRQKCKRGFETKKEAQDWERSYVQQNAAGIDMTFDAFCGLYEKDRRPRLKESTWLTKENIIKNRLIPTFGKMMMSEIETKHVIAWQNELLAYRDEFKKPYSATYLKTVHNQLVAILNHAVRHYGLKSNPASKVGCIGSKEREEMNFWTKEEYMKFAEAIMDKPMSYYAFEMLYWCGIREGEMLALTPADFNFTKKTVRINKTYQRIHGQDLISIKTVSEAKEHDEKRKQGYISHSTIPQKDRKTVSAARYEQREYDEKELEERLGVNEIFSVDWKGAS